MIRVETVVGLGVLLGPLVDEQGASKLPQAAD